MLGVAPGGLTTSLVADYIQKTTSGVAAGGPASKAFLQNRVMQEAKKFGSSVLAKGGSLAPGTTTALGSGGKVTPEIIQSMSQPQGTAIQGGGTAGANTAQENLRIMNAYPMVGNRIVKELGLKAKDFDAAAKTAGVALTELKTKLGDVVGAVKFNFSPTGGMPRVDTLMAPIGKKTGLAQTVTERREQELQATAAQIKQGQYLTASQRAPAAMAQLERMIPGLSSDPKVKITTRTEHTQHAGDVTTVTAAVKDATGATQRFVVSQNEAGTVLGANSKRFASFGQQIKRDTSELIK